MLVKIMNRINKKIVQKRVMRAVLLKDDQIKKQQMKIWAVDKRYLASKLMKFFGFFDEFDQKKKTNLFQIHLYLGEAKR